MAYNPNNNPYVPGDPYSYDLKWIVQQIKDLLAATESLGDDIEALRQYVDDYFAQLDIPSQVQAIIQQMVDDGDFDQIINDYISTHGVVLADTDQSGTFSPANKAQARKNIAAGASNINLLDNPFFTINQREEYTGTTTALKYTADRWACNRAVYDLTGSGFSLAWDGNTGTNAVLLQRLGTDQLTGKTVTLSAIIDGALHTITGTASDVTPLIYTSGNIQLILLYDSGLATYAVQILNSSTTAIVIECVKLEYAGYSTLQADIAPDYKTELVKCQYYFKRIHTVANQSIAPGAAHSTGSVRCVLNGTPMYPAASPSVAYSGSFVLRGPSQTGAAVTAINTSAAYDFVSLNANTSTTLTQYQIYILMETTGNGYIDISHDL